MAYLNGLNARYEAAHQFIARWARHATDCPSLDTTSTCTCGFNEAVHALNHYCTDQTPAPLIPGKKNPTVT